MGEDRAGRVVVGVDGSESALEAVRWGAREAAGTRRGLRLVHAWAWSPGRHHVGGIDVGRDPREALLETARAVVAAAAEAASAAAPDLAVEPEVVDGYPVPVLAAEAADAALLVLGSRGLGGLTGLLVGSVAIAVTTGAPCPVVVVRGDAPPAADRPVVVGVDGSAAGDAALAFAYRAADARGVALVAVHSWDDPLADEVAAAETSEALDDAERRLLAERLAGHAERHPDVPVETVVTRDGAALALRERSAGAQLVVVGSRGRSAFTGLVLGSVSHALLHSAECPVAVVRPPA